MTPDDFRSLALSMQDAVEGSHMGHPDFRANGRIFASLHTNDTRGMVKLTPDEQREFLRASPKSFEPSAGAWGRQGCTNVLLSSADPASVRGAMLLAWQAVASKPPVKKRATKKRK
jgi:YjbR protein